jgi:hypothetical protein|uniref:Uncharacterized protein n=1 Tax=Zea mays TaxID=4577 RepID=B8A051_MAIZE|nr:unknown [Zea mays]
MILACAVCAPFARRSRVLRSPSSRRSRALSRCSRAVSFACVIALSAYRSRVSHVLFHVPSARCFVYCRASFVCCQHTDSRVVRACRACSSSVVTRHSCVARAVLACRAPCRALFAHIARCPRVILNYSLIITHVN